MMNYEHPIADRRAHAILDAESRERKAAKIISLLGVDTLRGSRRILEIGCGSGVIAHTLSKLGDGRFGVDAVDVVDNRIETDGYQFQLVDNALLPFENGRFDIVISNYVIEHVGSTEEQAVHLREIGRVLAESGVAYLGIPNKWRLFEPHYRLPILSWLPQQLSDWYVKASGRGTYYDCLPLSLRNARKMLMGARFIAHDITIPALRETLVIEHRGSPASRLINGFVPDWVLWLALPIMPVYIFLLRKQSS
jgi:SAM-dependent methyltransferase